jgi:hypothetical protein
MVSSPVILLMMRNKDRRAQKVKRDLKLKLIYLRMTIRDRFKLHSKALLKNVNDSPWYTMYANGDDSDLVTCISLTRASLEQLLGAFKLFYIFKYSSKKGGRTPRVKDHHCVLALILHPYCNPAERKIWSEMFGIAPTTLDRTLLKAEEALTLKF